MTTFITKNHKKIPIRIGDTVKTGLGIGRVTFIRHSDDQTPRQFKVDIQKGLGEGSSPKFHDNVKLIKRAKEGKPKEIVVGFAEEQALKEGQKNPKNIGRIDHDLLTKIEHAKKQLRMSKDQPLRQSFFKNKIKNLEKKKTVIRSHLS